MEHPEEPEEPRRLTTEELAGLRPSEVLVSRLREIRARRGLSARQVAERVAENGGTLDRRAISKIENGTRGVTLDEAFVLAAALDVAPVYLFLPTVEKFTLVTPRWSISSGRAREWVRGRYPLPSQDSRVYWTERPDAEWDAVADAQRREREGPRGSTPEEIKAMIEAAGGRIVYTPPPTPTEGE